MYIFYPSCNFKKQFPETARSIRSYLLTQPDVRIAGCCKQSYDLPGETDTIVTICMSCMHILDEVRPNVQKMNFFEFLLTRENFPWPDLKGERITVQDCFRARGCHSLHDAVRKCLSLMNAETVEMEHNRDEEFYDGPFLFHPAYPSNIEMAPEYFDKYLSRYISIVPKEQWHELFKEHIKAYTTDRVVCYCNVCTSAARDGGADARHLAELIFQAGSPSLSLAMNL